MHGKINLSRSRRLMSILRCARLLVRNAPSKAYLHPIQTTTMHAYYLYINGLEIQTYTDQTINSSWIGTGKAFYLLLWMSQLSKVETGHRSANLILGSSSTALQLLCFVSPLASGKDKGLGQWEYTNGQSFFAIFFPLPNGTPTPSFIGWKGLGIWINDRM